MQASPMLNLNFEMNEEDLNEKLANMSVMVDSVDDSQTEIDQNQSVMDQSVFGDYARPPVDKDNINK